MLAFYRSALRKHAWPDPSGATGIDMGYGGQGTDVKRPR